VVFKRGDEMNLIIIGIYALLSFFFIRRFSYYHTFCGEGGYEYSLESIFFGIIFPITILSLIVLKYLPKAKTTTEDSK